MTFNITQNVKLKKDDRGVVRKISHPRQAYKIDESTSLAAAVSRGEAPSPRQLADEYLQDVLPVFGISGEMADNLAGAIGREVPDEGSKLHYLNEQEVGHQMVVSYAQTELGLPVWQAGIAVKLASEPYRVISSQSSVQTEIEVEQPSANSPYLPEGIDPGVLARLLGLDENQELTINDKRLLIYRFDPDDRGNGIGGHDHDDETQMHVCAPTLPVPAISDDLVPGRYYVISEVLFTYGTAEIRDLNWSAFIEPRTGSVVRLDCFIGCFDGFVFLKDPLTKTGDLSIRPNSADAILNQQRDRVFLDGLNLAGTSSAQELRGEFVNVRDIESPDIPPPTVPPTQDFLYSVPTDNFSAVNAYYHCDRLFRMLQDMGFDVFDYFDGTVFPVLVDHRVSYGFPPTANTVNASAPGNTLGNGSDGFRFALVQRNTNVGMAVEWRVILHEFGHTILWDHLNSPNFFFAHSPGDSLAAILNDPDSKAPDRFVTFPWTPIRRRHDRRPEDGWGYGGHFDPPTRVGQFGSRDRAGYDREQILSSTLFRFYRAIGGDHSDPAIQTEASRYAAFLIFSAVGALTSIVPPRDAEDFADELMDADLNTDEFEALPGGLTHKIIRWAFERQGLYQAPGAPSPTIQPGAPPEVDVYIDDGRNGEYDPKPQFIFSSNDIWNRLSADNGLSHQNPIAGQPNFLYVRVKNRGTLQAENVIVKAFLSTSQGNRLWPQEWSPLDTTSVPATGALSSQGETIVGPFTWTPSNVGSIALLTSVSADDDPSNADSNLVGSVPAIRLAHYDNNIAGRIVRVVASNGGSVVNVDIQPRIVIPDADPMGVVSSLAVSNSGTINQLKVSVVIMHTYIGDLRVSLSSPSGTTIVLFEGQGQPTDNLIATFSSDNLPALATLNGESVAGIWRLRVVDRVGLDEGTLVRWGLEITLT